MKKIWLAAAGITVAAFLVVPVALAKVTAAEVAQVKASETVDDDLYMAGEKVVVEGTVNGDVYAAGSKISIRGTVNGDVYAAGESIEITGVVKEDVVAAGRSLELAKAKVGGGVSFVGETADISSTSSIGGGVNFAGRRLNLSAPVARGVMAAGDRLSLGASVGRDVNIVAGSLQLEDGAVVEGDLNYRSRQEASMGSSVQIKGEVNYKHQEAPKRWDRAGLGTGLRVWSFLAALVVGVLLLHFARKPALATAEMIAAKPLMATIWGGVVLVLALPVFVLLLLTVIGIPLALILAALFAIAIYLTKIVVALAIGNWIAKSNNIKRSIYLSFILGLMVYYLLMFIPVINVLASLWAILLGLGAMVMTKPQSATAKK